MPEVAVEGCVSLRPIAIFACFVSSLAALSACREPTTYPDDFALPRPKLGWRRSPGMPLGEGRAGLPLVQTSADRRLIGFGGSPTVADSVWAFSLRDDAWSTLILGTTPPRGRTGHCAAFVPPQNLIVYVGGADDGGTAASRALTFSVGTPGFLEVLGDAPRPTQGCGAAYLVGKQRAYFFGGLVGGKPSADTWSFDPIKQTFQAEAPLHLPPARAGGTLAFDPGPGDERATGQLVLFGGRGDGVDLADVWRFDGNDWGELGTTGDPASSTTDAPRPLGRAGAAAAIDPIRRLLYVFGGVREGVVLDDLWRLDLRTLVWERLDVGPGPAGRTEASVTYDALLDRVLVFGGRGATGLLADGWTLSPAP